MAVEEAGWRVVVVAPRAETTAGRWAAAAAAAWVALMAALREGMTEAVVATPAVLWAA